ncbi:MAG: DNA mismatch repair protein MutS [Tannerella sp.]|jgi:hypothetical protein|nr:DNA mismatch repair protein MutS [Tannerella sp.]
MEEVVRFYEDRIAHCQRERETLKKRIHTCGTVRLAVFIAAVATLWLCRSAGWMVCVGSAIAFAVPFIRLMLIHNRMFIQKAYVEEMIRLNTNELKGLACDFGAFDGAPEQTNAQHAFGMDLDIFGERSLFQSMNRTVTDMGKTLLVNWFSQPLTDKTAILRRRQAVCELASKAVFRQHFFVTGTLRQAEQDAGQWLKRLADRQPVYYFTNRIIWRVACWVLPAVWLGILAGNGGGQIPWSVTGWVFAASILVSNLPAKRIHSLHKVADRMEKFLLTYSDLMKSVEQELFRSDLLQEAQQRLHASEEKASQAIKRLANITGALDQRFSLAGMLLNLFTLRDMRQAMRLERWFDRHAHSLSSWFEALAQVDALCSAGGFAFNHPDYAFPVIVDTYFRMEGIALGHPLMNREQCVRNDLFINGNPCFLVITGANMAGKSTWLRTVGVNFLLACMGLPVCAESLTVSPAHLVTSLRTSDSLATNESYFFAELKRLKMIIDRLNAGEKLFIMLDEILKGTNSTDRQTGSLALMRQLIACKTCGLIATHDLLLGTLEQEFPDKIVNYCFEAEVSGHMLTFTYRIRRGIAQNMNASFLMKEMGITL